MILKNGNLGIGNTSPVNKLDVIGDANILGHLSLSYNTDPIFTIEGPIININQNTDNDILAINQGIYNRFHINNRGNVGIGSSQPEYSLDVDGTIKANGNLITTGTWYVDIISKLNNTLHIEKYCTIGAAGIGNYNNLIEERFAEFRHKLITNPLDYAIGQWDIGMTIINGAVSQPMYFCEGGYEKMVLKDAKFGIGLDIGVFPSHTFEVVDYATIGAAGVGNFNKTDTNSAEFRNKNVSAQFGYALGQRDTGETFWNSPNGITFSESGFTKMYLKDGNLDIGTQSPEEKLHIFQTKNNDNMKLETNLRGDAKGPGIQLQRNDENNVFKSRSYINLESDENQIDNYHLIFSKDMTCKHIRFKIGSIEKMRITDDDISTYTHEDFKMINFPYSNRKTQLSLIKRDDNNISQEEAYFYLDEPSNHLFIKTKNSNNIRFYTGSTQNVNISTTLFDIKTNTKINGKLTINDIYSPDWRVRFQLINNYETSIYGLGTTPIKFKYIDGTGVSYLMGSFSSNGNLNISGSYSPPSDVRIKTNIQNYKTDIETFEKISLKKFDCLDIDKKNQIGVIAQEIKEVNPEIIEIGTQLNYERVKDFHFIKPDDLIYYLISVVQQLTERIEVLENKGCVWKIDWNNNLEYLYAQNKYFKQSQRNRYIYNMLWLIEIAKHNQMFHWYWNFQRTEFNCQFENLLDNKMLITIPNMDYKFFKKKYKKDLDCYDNEKQKNDNLILRKEYLSILAKEK